MKNVLVTGASKGIGKVIAQTLNEGYNVIGVARSENLLKECNFSNYFVFDFSNKKDLLNLADFIKEKNIDILINNAGQYIYEKVEKISFDETKDLFLVNSITPILLSSMVVPYMKSNKWGRIINIGSISGVMGEAGATIYSATKASLIGFTKALALELAQDNITVNTINPGWVDTELGEISIEQSEFSKDEIVECIPQRRFVEPVEIANLIKYLISPEAKGVTGQSINICAGLSLGY